VGTAGALFVARAQANDMIIRNLQRHDLGVPALIISEGELDELCAASARRSTRRPRRCAPLMARARAAGHELGAALRRILCIAAHPDDNEFSIAGSAARWAREGRHVTFCLVTTGGAGVNEHTPSSDGLIPIRERETHAAARILA